MPTDDSRRAIGKLTSLSADRFVVEMHRGTDNFTVVGFDDMHYVAALGSFVVMPVQGHYVVSEVIGLWEKDPTTLSRNDTSTVLEKASSAKFLEVIPVGTLPQSRGNFRFGVSTFPSLYTDVLYVRDQELDRIFEVDEIEEIASDNGDNVQTRSKAITIGSSVVFQGYEVKARIDEFFGGHVAVLGNTGSGKSCTVATILQSLFDKKGELFARGASFVLLDVNGEYRQAFSQLPESLARSYFRCGVHPKTPPPPALDHSERTWTFRLPHWFMSVEEWELLLRASERTQQPVLRMALGLTSLFSSAQNAATLDEIRNHILASCVKHVLASDTTSPSKSDRIASLVSIFATDDIDQGMVGQHIEISYGEMADPDGLIQKLDPFVKENISIPNYANEPFAFEALASAFELALLYEEAHGNSHIRDYCSQMLTRYKWLRDREEFSFLRIDPQDLQTEETDIGLFVERFLGLTRVQQGLVKESQISILDMNDAPDEVVQVVSAVMTRLVFDRLRSAEPRNQLPVHMVLEEAHRYIAERPSAHAINASAIFERVAKEGRKYGAFLMVASQRPSELSKTVLSQCSNFVVHRIQNPDDLVQIRQMTPYISDGVLKRLPSLPKQHALIFGNAVNLPTTFKVRDVNPRPRSDDAKIRDIWYRPASSALGTITQP